ncbi:MAG: arylsulfatase, partial [Cyclobacteriaceae bacterium]
MKVIVYLICFLLLMACDQQNNAVENNQNQSPNVVIILTDDQGWGDVHAHGNDSLQTPTLDFLAQNSQNFDRFYVSPVCAPTRAAMLTGRYPARTGVTGVTNREEVMRAEEVTLAEILQYNGYATGMFGKWHNGEQYPNNPLGQGFNHFFGFTAGHWNNYFNTTLNYNGKMVPTEGYITDLLTDSALVFIDKNQDTPFLCYLAYNTPHSPFQVPEQYFQKYKAMGFDDKNASVYGMVENIDDNVGRVVDQLENLNLIQNTILIFFTDNGPNGHRYNGSMKGVKGWVDEGGIRVPFYLYYPGVYNSPRMIKNIAGHIDILPTVLELCKLEAPADLQLDGKSLVPLMQDDTKNWQQRSIYTNWGGKGSLRNDKYRMVVQSGDTMLFDMFHDPGQHRDIYRQEQAIGQEMAAAFGKIQKSINEEGTMTKPSIPV